MTFRQVDPEKNKAMADLQSKETHMDNMKVVRVNAQVTSMVSFGEIVGFLMIAAISFSIKSATVGDVLFPLLQYIILPYAFLMNTRENKHRIVEQGWTNVLKNTLNNSLMSLVCTRRDDVEPISDKESNDNASIYIVSRNAQQISSNTDYPLARNNKPSICNINVPENVHPGTSSLFVRTNLKNNNCHGPPRPTSSKSEDSIVVEEPIIAVRNELIHKLLLNIDKETAYVRIFTQLVSLEQGHAFTNGNLTDSSIIPEEMIMETVSKLLSTGGRQRRVHMRKDALQRLQRHQKIEHEYKESFDAFVNMEEEFIEGVE